MYVSLSWNILHYGYCFPRAVSSRTEILLNGQSGHCKMIPFHTRFIAQKVLIWGKYILANCIKISMISKRDHDLSILFPGDIHIFIFLFPQRINCLIVTYLRALSQENLRRELTGSALGFDKKSFISQRSLRLVLVNKLSKSCQRVENLCQRITPRMWHANNKSLI